MKKIAGYIRATPGADPVLNKPVSIVFADGTSTLVPVGGMYAGSTNPINTDSMSGYFEWTCELHPGPIELIADISAGVRRVRSSRELMVVGETFLSEISDLSPGFSDGILTGVASTFTTTNSGKVITVQPGAAKIDGHRFETATNRVFTAPDNSTLTSRRDLVVLQQHVDGDFIGRQVIALVVGTITGVDPVLNSDPDILETPIYRSTLPQSGSAVTLTDMRSYSSITLVDGSIRPVKLANYDGSPPDGVAYSTPDIAKIMKAPASPGSSMIIGSLSTKELNDFSSSAPANTQIPVHNGSIWVPTNHDHTSQFYTKTQLDAGQLDTLYSLLAHNHDSRYYTESEIDAIIAGIAGATPGVDVKNAAGSNLGHATILKFLVPLTLAFAGGEASIDVDVGTGAAQVAAGDHGHNYATTTHTHIQAQTRIDGTIKSYAYTDVVNNTTAGTMVLDFAFSIGTGVTYDCLALAVMMGHMKIGDDVGNCQLGVKWGSNSTSWGSQVGTAGGERPLVAYAREIGHPGGNVQVQVWGRSTSTGTGQIASGALVCLAFPRNTGSPQG